MDENKFKAIVEGVVNMAIDPIKKDLSIVKKDLNGVKEDLGVVKKDLNGVKEDLGVVKKDLNGVRNDIAGIKETQKDHTRKLEALSGDMEQVLSEVKATHDEIGLWHQRDKREIDEIKNHLNLPLMADIPEV